jgi:hypothetical protein
MQFFRFFPTVQYSFERAGTPFVTTITNPTVHFKIQEKLKEHIAVLYNYIVSDGERPDTVAMKLYGSPDYTWVVLMVNNIFSFYDWPLASEEFNRYIIDKYGSVAQAQACSLYQTADGYFVDATTYNGLLAAARGSIVSAYDDELTKNEAKRRIRVVPAAFVEPLVTELRAVTGQ